MSAEWYGSEAINVVFETPDGGVDNRIVFQDDIASLELVSSDSSGLSMQMGICYVLQSKPIA